MMTKGNPGAGQFITDKKFVDIDQVVRQKSERLYRLTPGFVLNWLKRVMHQDEVNHILYIFQGLEGLEFIDAVLGYMRLNVKFEGVMDWDPKGRYVFVANHPLGGMDGIAFMGVVGKYFPDLVFPVNDVLLNVPNLRSLFIPVNKHGRNPELVKLLDDTFAGSRTLLYFPAGLVSRRRGGKIEDLEWKKTFVTKARQHNRDIVPVHITGQNTTFFYRLANLRKALGIGLNLEMFFLVDEMAKQKGKSLTIRFGHPIPCSMLDRQYTDARWAEKIKDYVYRIGNQDMGAFEP